MVNLSRDFSRLSSVRVALLGDFMLDTYTIGRVRRKSPEAPVVIVQFEKEEQRAGGAGNAVLNLLSLGVEVIPVGRIGDDSSGSILQTILKEEGVPIDGLFVEKGYTTPVKNRIVGDSQQIVRIDHEKIMMLRKSVEERIIQSLPSLFKEVDVIAISDYGKGFLTPTLLGAVIEYGKNRQIPVIVDPKGTDFSKYRGATYIKPNESEIYAAANLTRDDSLSLAAAKVLAVTGADAIMVTRSEAGISLFYGSGEQRDFPVHALEVKDVTGAGDTVLAMLTCGIGNALHLKEVAPLCNVAAGIAIERFGCARVTLSDVAQRLLELNESNKRFDAEHIFVLQQALKGKKTVAILLNSEEGLSSTNYQKLVKFSQQTDGLLLVHVPETSNSDEFVSILCELQRVDFVFTGLMPFTELCRLLEIEETSIFCS